MDSTFADPSTFDKNQKSIYIAGPMTGLPDFNYPMFNSVHKKLSDLYPHILFQNPASLFGGNMNLERSRYMEGGLKLLMDSDACVVLPLYQMSKGALLELQVAEEIGLPCYSYEELFPQKSRKIALTGYSGVGKDCVGLFFTIHGYNRIAFGDIIKRQLDSLIRETFGFSAFTNNRSEKELIRRILEEWGYTNYDRIIAELLETMPHKCINTRLFKIEEAEKWKELGGEIWIVSRKGIHPTTEREKKEMDTLVSRGLINGTIHNNFETLPELRDYLENNFNFF